jgi:hypothetical protein
VSRKALWLVLLIAAAVAGYLVGARSGEGSGTQARNPTARTPLPPTDDAAPGAGPAAPPPRESADPAPAAEGIRSVRDLLTKDLRETPDERAVQDAASRAEKKRRAYLAAADSAEAEAAREVAEEIRRERAFLEDKARGGTMELLRNLDTQLTDLVADEKRFAALFERRTNGPLVNATSGPNETLADGTTLSFPPGVHELRLPRTERFPRDVLIQGSGMDATLLRFAELDARDEVHSLAFRDVTIDCQNNYFTDLRNSPASIRLERCRVVRFDMGAGGSVMLSVRPAAAFYATECRFEAGFGSSPGSGNLFRFNAGLVRLDGCTIQGPFRSIYNADGKATYLFRRCDIRDVPAQEESTVASPPQGVRFVDCTFTYLARDAVTRNEPRPLSDLNPAWPAR